MSHDRFSSLVPNDNVYVIKTASDLPQVVDRWRIYHLLYDPGAGAGLYYSPDAINLTRLATGGSTLPAGTVDGSIIRWDSGGAVWLEFTSFILPAADGALDQIMQTDGAGVVSWVDIPVSGITIEEEGVPLATLADTLDFVGSSITASGAGSTKTITAVDQVVTSFTLTGLFGTILNLFQTHGSSPVSIDLAAALGLSSLQVMYILQPVPPQITVNDGQPLTIDLTSAGNDVFAVRDELDVDIWRASDIDIEVNRHQHIIYDTFQVGESQYTMLWNPTVSITGSYVGGALSTGTIFNVTTGVFIPAIFSDGNRYNIGAVPGFSAITFINELSIVANDGNFNLPGALVINVGLVHERNTAGTSTTALKTGLNWAPQTRSTISGGIMTITGNQVAVNVGASFSTVAGATVNLGTIIGMNCVQPAVALFQPQAGTENMTAYYGLNFNDMTFGGAARAISVVRSLLTESTNTYFLDHTGTAKSRIGGPLVGTTFNGVPLTDAGIATNFLDETGAYSVPAGLGGQVDSVSGGTNINVTGTAVDPIVNLDAAILGVSVNGVTLTTAGVATNFLDETGAYSVPVGLSPNGTLQGDMLYWDTGTPGYLPTSNLAWLEATRELRIGSSASSQVAIRIVPTQSTNYIALRMEDQAGNFFQFIHDYSLSTANQEFILQSSAFGDIFEIENEGNIYLGGGEGTGRLKILVSAPFGDGEILIDNGATLFMQEITIAQPDNTGEGQWWVRDDDPNVPMFTDDLGNDYNLLEVQGGSSIIAAYRFQTSIVEADPGNGNLRYDNATPASVTELFISSTTDNGVDLQNILSFISANDRIYFQQDNDASKYILFDVTVNVDNGGWFSIAGSVSNSGTIPDNNAKCHILILFGAQASGVASVSGGTNINITGTAVDPIVNLDAAVLGTSVNGVTLDAGGVATNFLDETGAYSVPAGTGLSVTPTPAVGEFAIWDSTGATIAGEPLFTLIGSQFTMTGFLEVTSTVVFNSLFYIQGMANAGADVATFGQAWYDSDDDRLKWTPDTGVDNILAYVSELGGQVDSVAGGTNINVTGTAVDPIVNLDAALLGVSVNGVTLNAAGAATSYLDETGAYSVPVGTAPVDSVFTRTGAVVAEVGDYSTHYLVKTGGAQTCVSDVTINGGGSLTIDDPVLNFRLRNSTDLLMYSSGNTENFRISQSSSLVQFTGSGFAPPDHTLQIQNFVGLDINVQTYFQTSITIGGNSNPGSGASWNVPHGAIPSAPINGDFWTTTLGAFIRISGVTVDLTASGGQVDSVSGGTNINVSGTAVDPIVNLDAAITGVSVNGVTLTTGGVATNYLDETGAYSVPPGGATTFAALTDVDVAGVADHDMLFFDTAAGDWKDTAGLLTADVDGATINMTLNNVTSAKDGQLIINNGVSVLNSLVLQTDSSLSLVSITTPLIAGQDIWISPRNGGRDIVLKAREVWIAGGIPSTEHVAFSDDDVDFNTVATGKVDWNISGFSGAIRIAGMDMGFGDNDQLMFGTGNDVLIDYTGTNFVISNVGVGAIQFADSPVHVRGGEAFAIFDGTNNDLVSFVIDGTDLVVTEVGMDAVRFSSINLRMGDGDILSFGNTDDAAFDWNNAASEFRLNLAGATNEFEIRINGTQAFKTIGGGATSLGYNGVYPFQTQEYFASGETSGAQILAHSGHGLDVGFNEIRKFNDNVSDTLEASHCGQMAFKDTTTARTLTLAAVGDLDFPVNGMTTVVNAFTSTDYTITEGASTTLYYLDGATRVDTAGGCTIGPGGVANIWREAAGVYYIWGTGITP